jgi:hypothetical protein
MKVSELVAELNGHQPDGPVVIEEIDGIDNTLFVVESIAKEEGKIPLLMVRSTHSYGRLPNTLKQTFYSKDAKLRTEIVMSLVDRKWRVIVEDSPVLEKRFESEAEARIFLQGFVLGFAFGTARNTSELTPCEGGLS